MHDSFLNGEAWKSGMGIILAGVSKLQQYKSSYLDIWYYTWFLSERLSHFLLVHTWRSCAPHWHNYKINKIEGNKRIIFMTSNCNRSNRSWHNSLVKNVIHQFMNVIFILFRFMLKNTDIKFQWTKEYPKCNHAAEDLVLNCFLLEFILLSMV